MSDEELIARLRDWPYQGETMAGEAADRIAALTAQLAEEQAHSERQASGHREDLNEIADVSVKRLRRAEAAEAESAALRAKVARLEGVLRKIADCCPER